MSRISKSIKKTDDSALALLYDILGDDASNIADIDSYYRVRGSYIFLEFLKVDAITEDFTPNEIWDSIKDEIINLWQFTLKAEGSLWLISYTEEKSLFKLFKVKEATISEVSFKKSYEFNLKEIKEWFQLLNREVLKG